MLHYRHEVMKNSYAGFQTLCQAYTQNLSFNADLLMCVCVFELLSTKPVLSSTSL